MIHLCGSGNLDLTLEDKEGYVQYEYIGKELPHLFAITDFMVSRAGSNAINELHFYSYQVFLFHYQKVLVVATKF